MARRIDKLEPRKLPSQGKLMAHLHEMTAAERARAGITDEMANAGVRTEDAEQLTGCVVEASDWQPDGETDVEEQIRVVDYDTNQVLFAGTPEQYEKLKRAIQEGSRR